MRLSRTILGAAALIAAFPAVSRAQARRSLEHGDPETQLLGYYAAIMQFTPVGLPARDGRLELGGAATRIPTVSFQDRLVGFGGTKSENTNLCPAYPRITAAKGFGRTSIEAGFTPPVTVCGVKASVLSLAVGRRMTLGATWEGVVRLSVMTGHVDVSATCGPLAVANPQDQTCFGGTPSADRIAPMTGALDFAAAWQGWQRHHLEPYALVGIRYERIDFDVNYTRTAAQAALSGFPELDDHNRLRASLARVHLGAGMAWDVARPLRLGAELYYAPSAVLTLRVRGALVL